MDNVKFLRYPVSTIGGFPPIMVFILLITSINSLNAYSGQRVALLIGNGSYENVSSLKNAVHDAEDMSKTLRNFDFKVLLRKNVDRREMKDAIADFGRASSNAEVALFFYAGHGIQSKSMNYLIPVNAEMRNEADIEDEGVNMNYLLDTLEEAKSKVNLVILDACRNNPFGSVRSGSRGLAPLSDVPSGTVIVYAAEPGKTASDGSGRNGLFTSGMLTAFHGDDLSLDGVLTTASEEVERISKNEQIPYVNGPKTLQKHFHFSSTQLTSEPSTINKSEPSTINKYDKTQRGKNQQQKKKHLEDEPSTDLWGGL